MKYRIIGYCGRIGRRREYNKYAQLVDQDTCITSQAEKYGQTNGNRDGAANRNARTIWSILADMEFANVGRRACIFALESDVRMRQNIMVGLNS